MPGPTKYECEVCGEIVETGGEYNEKSFEDEGWYLSNPVTCPEHGDGTECEICSGTTEAECAANHPNI